MKLKEKVSRRDGAYLSQPLQQATTEVNMGSYEQDHANQGESASNASDAILVLLLGANGCQARPQ